MRQSNATLPGIAPFTMAALVLNVVLYCITAARSGNLMSINTSTLLEFGASRREGLWVGEWFRLIAPMFLHVGLLHIACNMSFLWRAGPEAEIYFGTANFGTIYLLSGLAGFCLSQLCGGRIAVGASGSLCGIMGANLAVLILNCPVPSRAWRNAAVRAEALNLLVLFAIGIFGFINMDNWGHLGGVLAGIALGASFELWRRRIPSGKVGLFATLALIGLLVCAARWTFFNPRYQIFQSVYAAVELKDSTAEKYHADEARKWARTWSSLHFLGVLNEDEVDTILNGLTE